ncbi:MAG: MAPEG family protein [Gammaproteobacteria bacterium]|jgi:uncharacterized membrane protein YecN with MAPEG domain|nr:MAPEG family protein [Gammaproteobacteria bacterium]
MIVTIYVAVYTLIILWLSLKVINNRRKYRVSLGDGGVQELQIAMGAHSNATEYLPIGLVLLAVLELNGAWGWLIHLFGVILIVGRGYHINGMFTQRLQYRVWGMKITIFSLLALAAINVAYLGFVTFW